MYSQSASLQSIGHGLHLSPETKEFQKYDIIIIGAGLSGLTAAFRLFQLRPNLKIKILEANDRIGGRLLSTELPAANNSTDLWDIGGCWIGNKEIQPFVNQLLSELNLQTYPQNFVGKKIVQAGSNNNITKYSSSIPDINVISLIDTSILLKYLDNTQKNVLNVAKPNDNKIKEYDAMTADSMLQKRIWTKSTSDITNAAIRATFGADLDKLSALYLLMHFNSCGGFLRNVQSSNNSAQGYKVIGGTQGICTRILEIIGSETVELETVVKSIRHFLSDKGKSQILLETSGKTYKAKNVIVTIPPHLIPRIHFQPLLSPIKYEYFSSVSPGHLIKVILTYEKAFWKDEGLSGEIVTNGGPSFTEKCLLGPLCVVFDATTINKSPALLGLIGGEQALQYECVSKEERKEAVLRSLEAFFKKSVVRDFIVYCEKIWRQEPFAGGCPVSIVPPGVAKHINQGLRSSENCIHFAGSELAKSWMGFIEGAVESGERVALEILSENNH